MAQTAFVKQHVPWSTYPVIASTEPPRKFWFFLGGMDLEMHAILELLKAESVASVSDKGLAWGAKASDYAAEIAQRRSEGYSPVLVELTWDLGDAPPDVVLVDHHGQRAGLDKPSSLRQVFDLLKLPNSRWTRSLELIAANDSGYIPAMRELGAPNEEIERIRREDRRYQGVTDEEEALAAHAVCRRVELFGGALVEVELPHSRTSPVVDRVYVERGAQAGTHALAVYSPSETNVFASGDVIAHLDRTFPGGWLGGALPDYGYWGHGSDGALAARVRVELRQWVGANSRALAAGQ